ncbi:mechanosensitive ion channel family protein [Prevotella sp. 10(H)]|uniref:mechanosensitive ion channel family protein n=1 Tax=Prevotella sp. 10(H) TaxID=1158294 RepID=UPI0004A712E9|nr:mechanosensitive ion channel family protein [Prevotella sp. 10(H)]
MFLDIIPGNTLQEAELSISSLDSLLGKLFDYAVSFGLKIIAATIVFIIGRWLIKWLRKFIDRFLDRRNVEGTVKSFLDSLANITFQIVLFLMIVNILGVSTTSFAAILAAAGLAVGMAMKDNLSNFAGGVMILINKPFRLGDRIVAQGMDGTVQSIGILYTVLLTGDNTTIYIPNGPLSTGSITNYSKQQERRIDITFSIGYGADIDSIKYILKSVIKSNNLILDTPAPFIGVTSLSNGSVDVTIRVWVKSSNYGSVNVDLNEKVYATFRQNGIYVPSVTSIKMIKD